MGEWTEPAPTRPEDLLPPALRHLPGPGVDTVPDGSPFVYVPREPVGEVVTYDIGNATPEQFEAARRGMPDIHPQQVADLIASAPKVTGKTLPTVLRHPDPITLLRGMRAALAKIPSITKGEATKMARDFERRLAKLERRFGLTGD